MSYKSYRSYAWGGILIAVCAVFLYPKTSFALITADRLVISEIHTSGGLTSNDFIEIYNPTDSPIDLSGYRLVKRTQSGTTDTSIKSWTTSTVIPAKSFYLWANNGFTSVSADTTTSATIANDNAIALRFGGPDTGEIIDAVGWGSNASSLVESAVFSQNIPAGQSLERVADTNNNASDFIIQTVPTPRNLASGPDQAVSTTPALTYTAPPAPQIVITEVLPDPEGKDSGQEWIELQNVGSETTDITGWILDDAGTDAPGTTSWTLPAAVLAAGQYKHFYIPSGRFALNNDADSARLFNSSKLLVDQISYKDSEEGQAFAKDTAGWRWTSVPTPGTANQFVAENESAEITERYDYQVIFSEIFGNPKGADSGKEWIELANLGDKEVDLSGWYIDDAGSTLSKNAHRLPAGSVIKATGYLLISLPAGSFTITNIEEEIRLITPQGEDYVSVLTPEFDDEGISFARKNTESDEWELSFLPTPGKPNEFTSPSSGVYVSEIYFLESEDNEPFIEIKSQESGFVNLSGWSLSLGQSRYVLPEGASIAPNSMLLLNLDEVPLKVTKNNYLELIFARPEGSIQNDLSKLELTGGPKLGFSLVLEQGRAVWTSSPTPGQKNKIKKINTIAKSSPAPLAKNTITVPREQAIPVVAGANVQEQGGKQIENELPIIIEEKSNKGFFHKIFAKVGNWLLK